MPLAFYMDHHVPRAITLGLRLRGVDVLTAYEDGASELDDATLLDRASERRRVLFTRDDDLLAEAAKRQREEIPFLGVIYAHQLRVSIGRCVQDLEILAKAGEPADLLNGVIFLPL
jgi:predicted nuclease of predicted toxin-antitoxin system